MLEINNSYVFLSVFENSEKMILVMEYCSGGELYDYLSQKKVLQEDEARRLVLHFLNSFLTLFGFCYPCLFRFIFSCLCLFVFLSVDSVVWRRETLRFFTHLFMNSHLKSSLYKLN